MQSNTTNCQGCAVQQGYVPAGAVMQINESTPDALRYAAALECDEHEGRRKAAACLRAQHARIAELEARLEIDERHPYDGIAARDVTIKALDERIAQLEALLKFADERINKMQEDQTAQLAAQGITQEKQG